MDDLIYIVDTTTKQPIPVQSLSFAQIWGTIGLCRPQVTNESCRAFSLNPNRAEWFG
jgi:hypothetical protein